MHKSTIVAWRVGSIGLILWVSGCADYFSRPPSEWQRQTTVNKAVNVDSPVVKYFHYHSESRVLEVHYHSGAAYNVQEVPYDTFETMMGEPSPDSHYFKNVHNAFLREHLQSAPEGTREAFREAVYDPVTETLVVRFHNGHEWAFLYVPKVMYRELEQADDQAAFLYKQIFGRREGRKK